MARWLGVLAITAAACRFTAPVDVKPGTAPRCQGNVCVEIVSAMLNRPTIGMWIKAPPGTLLTNARAARTADLPCQGDKPVKWVVVDRNVLRVGPADVGGEHGLVLGFTHDIYYYDQGETFVDVELRVGGAPVCMRSRLDRAG